MRCIRIDPAGTLLVASVSYSALQVELGEALSDWEVPAFPDIIAIAALNDSDLPTNETAARIMGEPYRGPVYLLRRHYESLLQDEINCLLDYLEGDDCDD